jgi:hypothetical protein
MTPASSIRNESFTPVHLPSAIAMFGASTQYSEAFTVVWGIAAKSARVRSRGLTTSPETVTCHSASMKEAFAAGIEAPNTVIRAKNAIIDVAAMRVQVFFIVTFLVHYLYDICHI